MRLCGVPGAAADDPSSPGPRTLDGAPKKTARVRRSDGGSAFPSSSPTETALYKGHRVLWCYALSGAAKEAWTVALHRDVHRSRAMVDRATFSAAAAAAPGGGASRPPPPPPRVATTRPRRSWTTWRRCDRRARGPRRVEGARRRRTRFEATAETGWTSGGAAGAAVNAILSRILYDMQRSPDKVAELKYQLGNLCRGIRTCPSSSDPSASRTCSWGDACRRCSPRVCPRRARAEAPPRRGTEACWRTEVRAPPPNSD